MSEPQFVYVTYIATTAAQLWQALTDGELTKQYWGRHNNVSDWQPGSKWEHQDYNDPSVVDIVGEVLEAEPESRLVLTWAAPHEAAYPAKVSRVTFKIEAVFGMIRLTVMHEDLEPNSEMLYGAMFGWPIILSSLKTLLETGRPLAATAQRWEGPPA